MSTELSFAEAMALDPSEVEVWAKGGWEPLHRRPDYPTGDWVLSFLRQAKFRRAKPKRSRVQELAIAMEGADDVHAKERAECYREAIRAVCEYMRPRFDGAAYLVERHFLEPL